jgi:DNA polymerase III delta prime subunit
VFKDDDQKAQVKSWIGSGAISHLMFSGSPGTGKCLGPDELITVTIDESLLTHEQLERLYNILSK